MKTTKGEDTMTTILRVREMSCKNCAKHVREAILGITGVSSATVDLEKGEAVVEWKSTNTAEAELLKALETEGYPSEVVK